jgi:hypothetical protein
MDSDKVPQTAVAELTLVRIQHATSVRLVVSFIQSTNKAINDRIPLWSLL